MLLQNSLILFLLLRLCKTQPPALGDDIELVENEIRIEKIYQNEKKTIFFSLSEEQVLDHEKIKVIFDNIEGDVTFELSENSTGVSPDKTTRKVGPLLEVELQVLPNATQANVSIVLSSMYSYSQVALSYFLLESTNQYHLTNNVVLLQYLNSETRTKKIITKTSENKVLTSFYALNCDIDVKYQDNILSKLSDDFTISVTSPSPTNSAEYELQLKSIEGQIDMTHKDCLVFILSQEIENPTEEIIREGTQMKRALLKDFPKATLRYDLNPRMDSVIAHFGLEVETPVKIHPIVCGNASAYESILLSSEETFIIEKGSLSGLCSSSAERSVKFEVETTDKSVTQIVSFSVYQEAHSPIQISQNQYHSFLIGKAQSQDSEVLEAGYFVYSNIKKDEAYEIQVNMVRGLASLSGKLIRKDNLTTEQEPFRLSFNESSQRLLINNSDTSECSKGCTALIKVDSLDNSEDLHEFSLVFFNRNNLISIPKGKLIKGETKLENPVNYQFKSKNSSIKRITLEFKTSIKTIFFFTEDGTLPTSEKYSFKLDIEAGEGEKEIPITKKKDLVLTLGVYCEDKAEYEFRINEAGENQKSIKSMVADTSSICNIEAENSYCDFAFRGKEAVMLGSDSSYENALFYIPSSSGRNFEIYIKSIKLEEFNDIKSDEDLEKHMPTKTTYDISSKDLANLNAAYVKELFSSRVYLVRIYCDTPGKYQFYTTRYNSKLKALLLSRNKPHLILVSSEDQSTLSESLLDEESQFVVEVPLIYKEEEFMINIEKIEGQTQVKIYDSVIPFDSDGVLRIKSADYASNITNNLTLGFTRKTTTKLFITFEPINTTNKLIIDKNNLFVEDSFKLPRKKDLLDLNQAPNGLTVNVKLKGLENFSTIKIEALFASESTLKKEPLSDKVEGIFDPMTRAGYIYISREDVKKALEKKEDFLVISINSTDKEAQLKGLKVLSISPYSNQEKYITLPKGIYYNDKFSKTKKFQLYAVNKEDPKHNKIRVEFLRAEGSSLNFAVVDCDYSAVGSEFNKNSTNFKVRKSHVYSSEFELGEKVNRFYISVYGNSSEAFTLRYKSFNEDDSFYDDLFTDIKVINATNNEILLDNPTNDTKGIRKNLAVTYQIVLSEKANSSSVVLYSESKNELHIKKVEKNKGEDFSQIRVSLDDIKDKDKVKYIGVVAEIHDNEDLYYYFPSSNEKYYSWFRITVIVGLSLVLAFSLSIFFFVILCKTIRRKSHSKPKIQQLLPK